MNFEKIIKKYKNINFNEDNFSIGGGLVENKFASKRHEDAKLDLGKSTLGEVTKEFKNVTKFDTKFLKNVILFELKYDLEWHHSGKLPKKFGGGMKKTYFINAKQIIHLAENFDSIILKYNNHIEDQKLEEINLKAREELKNKFLKKYASYQFRLTEKPKFFYSSYEEMKGKYGFFESSDIYNLPKYYTGWQFRSKRKLEEFYKLL